MLRQKEDEFQKMLRLQYDKFDQMLNQIHSETSNENRRLIGDSEDNCISTARPVLNIQNKQLGYYKIPLVESARNWRKTEQKIDQPEPKIEHK